MRSEDDFDIAKYVDSLANTARSKFHGLPHIHLFLTYSTEQYATIVCPTFSIQGKNRRTSEPMKI